MTIQIDNYNPKHNDNWDSFCSLSINGTFLHTRKFLEYHGSRFKDKSLLIYDDKKLIGIFPSACSAVDQTVIVSHPGITYGGIIHCGGIRGSKMIEVFRQILEYYKEEGIKTIQYKVVPHIYHLSPAQDDLYALFRIGANKYRCDLSCAIDLRYHLPISERRKRSKKKSINNGIKIIENPERLPELWLILEDNLQRKHGVKPVHDLNEIQLLYEKFPSNINFVMAEFEGAIIAGVVLFISNCVCHVQYIASSEIGYEVCALDSILSFCIERSKVSSMRYFDFGISNENQGKILNEGLYKFKSEFGGSGVAHEFYKVEL